MSILCIVEKDTISKKFDFSEAYYNKRLVFFSRMDGWLCVCINACQEILSSKDVTKCR